MSTPTVESICAELGADVRDAPCGKTQVNDGKISRNKIARYVTHTPPADLKNLDQFGNDKDKFMKHIRHSDRQRHHKKQKIERSMVVPGQAGGSDMVNMMLLMLKAQADSTDKMLVSMQTANVEAAKTAAESVQRMVGMFVGGKSGGTGKVERAPKKVKSLPGAPDVKGGKGGKNPKVLKAALKQAAKTAFDTAQSDWEKKAKADQQNALGNSDKITIDEMSHTTKNNETLFHAIEHMNTLWREKLEGDTKKVIISKTAATAVADFNQR